MTSIDRNRSAVAPTGRQTVEKAQPTVTPAVNTVKADGAKVAKKAGDGFETGPARQVSANLLGGSKPKDKVYDGQFVGAGGQTFPPGTPLKDIPGVTPRNNPNPSASFFSSAESKAPPSAFTSLHTSLTFCSRTLKR